MPKLAVLADIHGNSVALRAVLNDLAIQGGADEIIVLGDLAVFGPDPWGVLTLLANQRRIFHVSGNTDRYLVEAKYPQTSDQQDWQSQVLASFPWAAEQLGTTGLQFLADLPYQQLFRFSQRQAILAVHGSPRSDEEGIRPNMSDIELDALLDNPSSSFSTQTEGQYNILLCGHTHIPVNRVMRWQRIINTGSVGLPFDGDQRASYVILSVHSDGNYEIEFRRVTYDIEMVIAQLKAIDHPTASISAQNLLTARPLSQKLIYTEDMRGGLGHKISNYTPYCRTLN